MSAKTAAEWTNFKVGKPSTNPNAFETSCLEMETVSHVAHVSDAISIISQKQLSAGLIFDKCMLNNSRILVVWFSPNDWGGAGGFRYGNVRFTIDWRDLVKGMNYYWVESMAYGIAAPRILITDQDRSGLLPVYDPSAGDGPWWYDVVNDVHYRNGHYCLEFMVERDVQLNDIRGVDFVKHSSRYCNIHRTNPIGCPDTGRLPHKAGALLLSRLVGESIAMDNALFREQRDSSKPLDSGVLYAAGDMLSFVKQLANPSGNISSTSDSATSLIRALLYACGRNRKQDAVALSTLFASEQDIVDATASLAGGNYSGSSTMELTVA